MDRITTLLGGGDGDGVRTYFAKGYKMHMNYAQDGAKKNKRTLPSS